MSRTKRLACSSRTVIRSSSKLFASGAVSREEQPTSADAVNEALHPTRTSPYSGKELRMDHRRQAGAGVEFVILCSGISPIKQELQGFKALQGSREQVGS